MGNVRIEIGVISLLLGITFASSMILIISFIAGAITELHSQQADSNSIKSTTLVECKDCRYPPL